MMTHVLHTFVTTLLSSTPEVHLDKVTVEQDTVRLQLTATAPDARCPCCTAPSSAVHSRYQRHLTGLPWGTYAVHLQLTVRKFLCRNPTCARRVFTERLPDRVAPSARSTTRLGAVLRAIGIALGGKAGARLADRLGLPTSATTLLRLVRGSPLPQVPTLQVVGVDEWA
jgi:transposase